MSLEEEEHLFEKDMIYGSYDISKTSKQVKECHIKKYLPLLQVIIGDSDTIQYEHLLQLIRKMFFNNQLKFQYIKKVLITLMAHLRITKQYKMDDNLHINWRSVYQTLITDIKHTKTTEEHQLYLNKMCKNKNLVFDSSQREILLNFCKEKLNEYSQESSISRLDDKVEVKKIIDFSTLMLLLFASGARFVTIYSLTINLYEQFISMGSIEMITKANKVTEIYLPQEIQSSRYIKPISHYHKIYGTGNKSDLIFTTPQHTLSRYFDRIYLHLFSRPRPKQLRWHAARRWWSGQIYAKCGIVATAKGMGHSSIFTTSNYVYNSLHSNDMKTVVNSVINI
jgi:hypothetical protein